jgi:hypothetical protein
MRDRTVTATIDGILGDPEGAGQIIHMTVTARVSWDVRDAAEDVCCEIISYGCDLPEELWLAAYIACGGDDAAEHAAKVAFWEIYREQQSQRAGGWS